MTGTAMASQPRSRVEVAEVEVAEVEVEVEESSAARAWAGARASNGSSRAAVAVAVALNARIQSKPERWGRRVRRARGPAPASLLRATADLRACVHLGRGAGGGGGMARNGHAQELTGPDLRRWAQRSIASMQRRQARLNGR